MSDLVRSEGDRSLEIILANKDLLIKHKQIAINELANQIKQLDARLDQMKSVEMKRLELKKETLSIEILKFEDEVSKLIKTANVQVIDVEVK